MESRPRYGEEMINLMTKVKLSLFDTRPKANAIQLGLVYITMLKKVLTSLINTLTQKYGIKLKQSWRIQLPKFSKTSLL